MLMKKGKFDKNHKAKIKKYSFENEIFKITGNLTEYISISLPSRVSNFLIFECIFIRFLKIEYTFYYRCMQHMQTRGK